MMTAPDDAMETVSAEGRMGTGVFRRQHWRAGACGYQAWFNAEGDGAGAGWRHYFHAGSIRASFDLWPDVAELGEDELHESPLRMPTPDGAVGHCARLYSASNASTLTVISCGCGSSESMEFSCSVSSTSCSSPASAPCATASRRA